MTPSEAFYAASLGSSTTTQANLFSTDPTKSSSCAISVFVNETSQT